MLAAKDFKEVDGKISVVIEWDDSQDVCHKETREFENKENALRYYASVAYHYILTGNEKIRNTAELVAVKLPPWTFKVLQMDAPELCVKILEQMQHFDLRAADQQAKKYIKTTIKKVQAAAKELKAICEKYNIKKI